MKKRLLSLLLAFAMLAAVMPTAVVYAEAGTKPSVGDGSEDNPYEIGTAEELLWFADRVSDGGRASICAVLTADITVNPGTFDVNGTYTAYNGETVTTWTPIGISSDYPYSGTFDGRNHTISGIYYDSSSAEYVGLFGYTDGAYIKNISVINSYVRGYDYVGGIVGYDNSSPTITNCFNTATVIAVNSHAGGIIGYASAPIITGCFNTATVTAINNSYAGGIVGRFNGHGTINKCGNSGAIGAANYCGGVAGSAVGTISNCYNTGAVLVTSAVGGVAISGIAGSGSQTTENCYNVGSAEYGISFSWSDNTISNSRFLNKLIFYE